MMRYFVGDKSWRWMLIVLSAGVALSAILGVAVTRSERTATRDRLAADGASVVFSLQDAVGEATEHIDAVSALFHARLGVTEGEFDRFVTDTGMTEGMVGLGFIRIVPAADLPGFAAALSARHPGLGVYEVAGLAQVAVAERPVYYPIEFFTSGESLPAWGFDAASDPQLAAGVTAALDGTGVVATGFLSLPGRPDADALVLFKAVVDPAGETLGVVAAALDRVGVLATADLVDTRLTLTLDVADPDPARRPAPGTWFSTIEVADRHWRATLRSERPDRSLLVGLLLFLGGVIVSSLLAGVVGGFAGRVRRRREIEELRRNDRRKDDFLATVSHELRTPLTAILGFSEELRAQTALNSIERGEMIDFIYEEAAAMEGIVQDLLVAARLQQGGDVPIHLAVVEDIAGEVARIGTLVESIRGIQITVTGNASIFADAGRFRQILRNLVDNAARYGEPPIDVTIQEQNGVVSLVLADHGSGVAKEDVGQLFDRYRSVARPDGMPTSTGIGLWLSRELARMMGGDLLHIGGSAFEVLLPAAPAPAADVPVHVPVPEPTPDPAPAPVLAGV